ncbi:DODA-type extradiol aromatic ring-opening family dioxygenase [Marinobacter segnicrescens]|uniref:DODA-type extradiol aromatic ring-opening family dioxygenase n=1 Tax=Marinobacter segnicrescens TaxID=430453 RepID=UPI003A91DB82
MANPAFSAAPATQPVLFIPHGAGPCFFMDWTPADAWHGMADFLRNIHSSLPEKPRAILMVSAHWLTEDFTVTAGKQPALIFDYYGFPEHTYELTYPAPGDPALAQRVTGLLAQSGLSCRQNRERGFDHGMFIPLKLMFPAADIPVVQLSLRADLDPATHQRAGKALETLRREGVLIIASGMSFHNMRGYGDPHFTPLSEAFDAWLSETMEAPAAQREDRLDHWSSAPYAHQCHPSGHEEHLLPLMVAAGAAGEDTGQKAWSGQVLETQLSAFRFGWPGH